MTTAPDILTVNPTRDPLRFRDEATGTLITVPDDWQLVEPGDPGLTRRLKAGGAHWVVVELVRNKRFSRGVLCPMERVQRVEAELDAERADPAYARRLEAGKRRRKVEQAEYVEDFEGAVRAFLRFSAPFHSLEAEVAHKVTVHATPVGSGTVARTERIPLPERARAAVMAWMRHQTTDYDAMHIARVKGLRREVRRDLAADSHRLLDAHRGSGPHATPCALCAAQATVPAPAATVTPPKAPYRGDWRLGG